MRLFSSVKSRVVLPLTVALWMAVRLIAGLESNIAAAANDAHELNEST